MAIAEVGVDLPFVVIAAIEVESEKLSLASKNLTIMVYYG